MVEFDPKYADSLTVQADELLKCARVEPAPVPMPSKPMSNPPHPVFVFTKENLIGEITSFQTLQDGEGTECGRFWTVGNSRIGWEGDAYKKIRRVASKLSSEKPLGEYISMRFALDECFAWLRNALEKKQDLSFAEYMKKRCEEELFQGEIWIPLCHTYANRPFAIGEVTFKAVHKSLMDTWYSQINTPADPDIRAAMNKERSALQAKLAGCVAVCAEPLKALDIALNKVRDATAMLRFLSHANWSCKIRSESVPEGTQHQVTLTSLSVAEGKIKNITRGLTESLPRPWNVTENVEIRPEVLARLHDLAKNSNGTELRKSLFESLLIYSRNNLTRIYPRNCSLCWSPWKLYYSEMRAKQFRATWRSVSHFSQVQRFKIARRSLRQHERFISSAQILFITENRLKTSRRSNNSCNMHGMRFHQFSPTSTDFRPVATWCRIWTIGDWPRCNRIL